MLGQQVLVSFDIHLHALVELLHLLVVQFYVLAVDQRRQNARAWVGVLQRRRLLHLQFQNLLGTQLQLPQRLFGDWLLRKFSLSRSLLNQFFKLALVLLFLLRLLLHLLLLEKSSLLNAFERVPFRLYPLVVADLSQFVLFDCHFQLVVVLSRCDLVSLGQFVLLLLQLEGTNFLFDVVSVVLLL